MERWHKQLTVLVAVVLSTGLFLTGCSGGQKADKVGGTGKQEAKKAKPYKVGVILSTTGSYAQMGGPEKDAIVYYMDKVNKDGGINGHPIDLIVEDDEGSPGKAQTLVRKLIDQDKVAAIIGPAFSTTCQAAVVVAEEKKVPLIFFSPTGKIAQGKKYIFYNVPDAALDAKAISQFMVKDIKVKTIGIIYDTTEYGKTATAEFEKAVADIPELKILAKEAYDPTDTDMSPQLLKIKNTSPDIIYIGGSGAGPARVLKSIKQVGYQGKVVGSSGVANDATIKNAGTAAEGIYISSRLNFGNPNEVEKALFDFVKEKNGGLPSSFHANGWDGALLLVNAMRTAGDDRDKIRDTLENTKGLQGVIGVYNMTPTNHNGLSLDAVKMVRIKDSHWVSWNN